MSAPSSFAALARAVHHGRHREALALIDALLTQMPDSASLLRQRSACIEAMAAEEAATIQPPELVRVDAALFSFDQQRECNAPAAELRALGYERLLDAASPRFSALGLAPVLIRFYGDASGDSVVVRYSATLQQRPAQLLACASLFSNDDLMLMHRAGDTPVVDGKCTMVHVLPKQASLTELVTRHAGRCAMYLRESRSTALRALRTLTDCDRVWRSIAPR